MTPTHPFPRRGSAAALLAATALLALAPAAARADDQGATWQYAPALAPPPPPGASPSPFPAALGSVGDISFWAPNQGLLITGGTSLVPAGLYAYDGVSWHELSTVCGSAEGRIAWAGPDDFWTISDQRPGQVIPGGDGTQLQAVSLCHFVGDQVVASYAMPLDQPDSYAMMDAAACTGPDDCWFGGVLAPNSGAAPGGAFHLHWDGTNLTVVDDTAAPHAVAGVDGDFMNGHPGMTVDDGQLYESDTIAPTDGYGPAEDPSDPPVLHTIVDDDPTDPFHPTTLFDPSCVGFCPTLPDFGTDANGNPVPASDFAGLAISSDAPTSADPAPDGQMWALDAPDPGAPSGTGPILLRYDDGGWSQIVPQDAQLPSGEAPLGVAADPGEDAVWITIADDTGSGTGARVLLLSSPDGGQTWSVTEQDALGPDQGLGSLGEAGPITCPAAHDCWLATTEGYLFHLTDGTQLPQDADPVFNGQDGVITFRPSDAGVPAVPSDVQPDDTSLLNQAPPVFVPPSRTTVGPQPSKPTKARQLITHVRSRLHHDTLVLTFTLAARAHVQVIARRHKAIVARTRMQTLDKGIRHVSLRLNPKRYPTALAFRATAAPSTKPASKPTPAPTK